MVPMILAHQRLQCFFTRVNWKGFHTLIVLGPIGWAPTTVSRTAPAGAKPNDPSAKCSEPGAPQSRPKSCTACEERENVASTGSDPPCLVEINLALKFVKYYLQLPSQLPPNSVTR
jgi:hypothetical protein